MCTHKREAETKNNSRIMQSSSFILERSFLLEYYRQQNKCDLYATWFEMQHLLLGSILVCFYDEAIKSWNFPCSSEGIIACLIQKYFRNNFRLKIKNLKNIEAKKNSAFFFKTGRNRKESILKFLKHTVCCEKFVKHVQCIRHHGTFIR